MAKKKWQTKSTQEKIQHVVDAAHTRPSFCLMCETRLLPADLASHRNRCPGRTSPDELDLWEDEVSATRRGMPLTVLRALAHRKKVRSRRVKGGVQYLVRDVEQLITAHSLVNLP